LFEYALVRRRTPETAAEVAFFGRLLTVTPVEKVHCHSAFPPRQATGFMSLSHFTLAPNGSSASTSEALTLREKMRDVENGKAKAENKATETAKRA
jgi:hypothetical protein